jgi:hypothetical protein
VAHPGSVGPAGDPAESSELREVLGEGVRTSTQPDPASLNSVLLGGDTAWDYCSIWPLFMKELCREATAEAFVAASATMCPPSPLYPVLCDLFPFTFLS